MIQVMPMRKAVEIPAADAPIVAADAPSALGLAELLLKDRMHVDDLLRDEGRQTELIPRFLMIALPSFSVYAGAMILLLHAAPANAVPSVLAAGWSLDVQPALALWLAYALGMVAAAGVCLPSFYFYGLLAGVRISFLQVVTHSLKGQAATAIMLMGILPIYVAVALGMLIFAAPAPRQELVLAIGLLLPFLAGLWGVASIYQGFMQLADTLRGSCGGGRRCFLRRLTLAWAACYTAVTPFMIYALWAHFTG
jgi:hypothetical protein